MKQSSSWVTEVVELGERTRMLTWMLGLAFSKSLIVF